MLGFFGSPVVRAILAFLALILVSLAIWFVGPLLAIGDLRPLASVGLRVSVICLLLVLVILMLLDGPLSVVGVASVCLLVWHAGPLLAFGAWHPLEPVWVRAMTIGLVLVLYAAWGVYKVWTLMRSDETIANKWLRKDKNAPKVLAREDVRAIKDKTGKAVNQLRQMHLTMAGGAGSLWSLLRRVVEGKRYLYELPWYMIIGTPGAGKSSVLLNSGLQFPVAEQMGVASAQLTLAQNTGTQNCAWWFTNEAVLIDTAGRYTNPQDGRSRIASAAQLQKVGDEKTGEKTIDAKEADETSDSTDEQRNAAEWQGFLRVLRQVRSRAPINGALLAVDVAKLLGDDASQAMAHAAQLRARLGELREQLGIRFPVYVVLTKADLLRGFAEYFGSLTTEARAQVWGFTLPWVEQGKPQVGETLAVQLERELSALQHRISSGVATRLQEEFDLDHRQALYVFPHEFAAMVPRLVSLLEAVFSDSRYDTTQLTHTLRGVYLTSAMQYKGNLVTADQRALVPRLSGALARLAGRMGVGSGQAGSAGQPSSTRSYFMTEFLSRVVFPESHLVKPNLRWEARFRLVRLVGHGLVFFLFFWFSAALVLSHTNNREYLADVGAKTTALTDKLRSLIAHQDTTHMLEVLGLAQDLPRHSGLDLENPASTYAYGLYAASPIADAAHVAYGHLQDRLILPVIIQRMETVLRQSEKNQNAKSAYDTLHVYMLLHDKERFSTSATAAKEVRNWVLQDWQDGLQTDGVIVEEAADAQSLATTFNNSSAMVSYLQDMFSGKRVVQSATARNDALVRQVRAFLDTTPSNERLYERAKAALLPDMPKDFSLARALGPQAGSLFSRASGLTLESGVPGLFTYDGYHDLFAKRLKDLVVQAQADDAWVMGRTGVASVALSDADKQALVDDIRRQYLEEYAQEWTDFLNDIRIVRAESGHALTFELNMLRQLAAPDSALVRLARMVARETTLSRPLQTRSNEEKTIFDKATEQLDQGTAKLNQNLGTRPEQRLERQYVDSQFGALREVVTGQSEAGNGQGVVKLALDNITSLLNEYYTALVVADAAIAGGSLPPPGTEAATKIKIEASKLPAPFREILLGVSANGADKIAQASANILRVQAQVQMDRLVGLSTQMVTEPCRRNIAGRYPFSASSQEVSIEDFNAFFGAGGTADDYFSKYLAPLVDTSERPWRYKAAPGASAPVLAADAAASPTAAPTGPTLAGELLKLLAQSGPNPDLFAQIAQIREAYFKEPGAKRMAWKLDVSVQSLDPSVTELVMDIDGQAQRYAHGPVQALAVQWPGPRSGTMAEISAQPRIRSDTSSVNVRGPWALMRLMEQGHTIPSASAGKVAVEFLFDNRRAVLEVASSGINPLSSNLLKTFNCTGRVS